MDRQRCMADYTVQKQELISNVAKAKITLIDSLAPACSRLQAEPPERRRDSDAGGWVERAEDDFSEL